MIVSIMSARQILFLHPLAATLTLLLRYDLGYIDLEEKILQPLDNPFGPRVLPI
jgi:hypothetical protein